MAHRLWLLSNADVPQQDPPTWTVGFIPIIPPTVRDLVFPSVIFAASVTIGVVIGVRLKAVGFGDEVAVSRTWMRENRYTGRSTKNELTSSCVMPIVNEGPGHIESGGGDFA